MTRYAAAAHISEHGTVNGTVGDSTSGEVSVSKYTEYHSGIDGTLRYMGADKYHIRNRFVKAMVYMANNPNIGYGQSNRTTSYNLAKAAGWSLTALKTLGKCNTDCSEMIAIAVNCAFGKQVVPADAYTGNLKGYLTKLGFTWVTSGINYSTGAGFSVGDILLNVNSHVLAYIGTKASGSQYVKEYVTVYKRGLYSKPGTTNTQYRIAGIPAGAVVTYLHHSQDKCLKVKYNGKTGWIHTYRLGIKAVKVKSYE